jgi:hypothetical protein
VPRKVSFFLIKEDCILRNSFRGFKLFIDNNRKKHGNKKSNSGLNRLPADISSADSFQDAVDSALQATAAGTSIQRNGDDDDEEDGDGADESTEHAGSANREPQDQ